MNVNSDKNSNRLPFIPKGAFSVWAKVSVQWRLHLLIQLSLIFFFLASQQWVVRQFDDMGINDIKTQANETSDGLINGLNLLMVTGQISDSANRELLVKKMSSSRNIKELRVARAEQVNAQFGPGLSSEVPSDELVKKVFTSAKPIYIRELDATGVHVLRAIIPFVVSENFRGTNCLSCHHVKSGSVNGAADIRMDLTAHEQSLSLLKQWLWSGMLLFQIVLSVFIAIFVRVILERHISKPVKTLQATIDKIHASGDLSMRVELAEDHPDVDKISKSINSFLVNLESATQEMDLLSKAVENSEEAILITDASSNIVFVNKSFERITGFRIEEALGQNPRILKSGLQDAQHYKKMWQEINAHGSWRGEIVNRRKNGQVFPEWQSISAVKNAKGEVTNYVSIFMDITKRKEAEAHIHQMANFDALTGLANRNLLNDRFSQALMTAHRKTTQLALMFLDLDNFKTVNDGHGHAAGDELLKIVSKRLMECIREGDTVSRQGGDEFILLLPDVDGEGGVVKVAEKLLETVAAPYSIMKQEMHVSVSIGIAIYPYDGDTVEKILKNADSAMYNAKADGRNCFRLFTHAMTEAAQRRYKLQSNLRNALKNCEFDLHYQPQLSKVAGDITGVEALIRWKDPVEGYISPAEFIPIAEDTGQIVAIGRWVLKKACLDAKKWHEQGYRITVSVNVSGHQFKEASFDRAVEEALGVSGLDPKYLELEMTEGVLIDKDESLTKMMSKLKALGLKLALDDFGTGYSSLSYIKKFPIDRIKIDQSFVRDVIKDPEDAAIVDAIIYIAHNLKMEIIAEGVETIEQLDFLSSRNCNDFQGYFISRPVPNGELMSVLETYRNQRQNKSKSDAQFVPYKTLVEEDQLGLIINISALDDIATINLSGYFSFKDQEVFESKCELFLENSTTKKLIINFASVQYIDSSALGMLLLLRNQVELNKKTLCLANPSEVVRNIFEIACFNKIFTIIG